MPVIPVLFAQVTHVFGGQNNPKGAAIVYGVENTSGLAPNALATVAATQFTASGILQRLTADVSLVRTDVKLGPNETGPIGSSTTGAGPGAQSGSSLAPGTSYLVTKGTAVGGRRGRGRIFLPGVDADNVDDGGLIASALRTPFQTALTTWLANMQAAEIPMHLLHDYPYTWELNSNGQPRRVPNTAVAPPAPTVVVSLTLDALVATQRRRLR